MGELRVNSNTQAGFVANASAANALNQSNGSEGPNSIHDFSKKNEEKPKKAVDSKAPVKAGEPRLIKSDDIEGSYTISDDSSGRNKGFQFVPIATYNGMVEPKLFDIFLANSPYKGPMAKSQADNRARNFLVQNAAYKDLFAHKNSGEKLPSCALAFMEAHENEVQKLGLKLGDKGEILYEETEK